MGNVKPKRGVWRAAAGVLLALLVGGHAQAYQASIYCGGLTIGGIDLRCAGPDSPDLNSVPTNPAWPGWAVLSVAQGKDVLFQGGNGDGGTATVPFGNVGLYGTKTADATGTAKIQGNVFQTDGWYGSAATSFGNGILSGGPTPSNPQAPWTRISPGFGFEGGFLTDKLLWYAKQDALAAAAKASLDVANAVATVAVGDCVSAFCLAFSDLDDYTLTRDLTINAVGSGTNYINIDNNLNLGGYKLTLSASTFANVDFVLNVGNQFDATGSSGIVLSNGVLWSDVLINIEGKRKGVDVAFSAANTADFAGAGVIIANGDLTFDKTQWQGEVIGLGGNLLFTNGSQVTNPANVISVVTFIPEPGTIALLLAGLLATGFSLRYGRARGLIRLDPVRV
jgi:hypothetical protein